MFSENPAINLLVDVKMENVRFHYCKVSQLTGVNPCSHQAVHPESLEAKLSIIQCTSEFVQYGWVVRVLS